MPELPEVETVRRGLARFVVGRQISAVTVHHPRAIRLHAAGADDFAGLLIGRVITDARRRGKYLWLPLDSNDAVVAHLGMSGQFILADPEQTEQPHLRVRMSFSDGGQELRFIDQRTFGGMAVSIGGAHLPREIAHIALDPLDPDFDHQQFWAALRRRRTGLKRALLDQSLISGVGNIYADEGLWRARLHYARPTETITRAETQRLLDGIRQVMTAALDAGGTSFDALYVNVNGEGGDFDRALAVYGRAGQPCPRCGTPIRRDRFMNRSAYTCPRCQPRPRRARW